MLKQEIIERIKENHDQEWMGKKIEESTTRDRVLFGQTDEECTGIVAAIYPSIDVIRTAIARNCNLIISHESLFWNHGDHTDWLMGNQTYLEKKKLLEDHHISVWRLHDYIHAGMDVRGRRVDGIFYGLLETLGWENYVEGDVGFPLILEIPKMKTEELIEQILEKLGLNGIKCLGSTEGYSQRIYIPMHIFGQDNDKITFVEKENIDTILAMECIDFTLGIYIKDSAMLSMNRRILAVGHFNLEEPGMRWYAEKFLPTILPSKLPISFVKVSDMYTFKVKNES